MKRIERLRPLLLAAVTVLCAWLCGFSLSTLVERGGEMGLMAFCARLGIFSF